MSGQPPYFYNYMNVNMSAVEPNMLHVLDTEQGRFFQRYLLKKAISVFNIAVPENWDIDYFRYVLYCYGYIAVINTSEYGVIPQICSLSGYNIYYQPTTALIANPYFSGIKSPRIGKDCILIKLQPDYCGIMDLCNYYAAKMALISSSIDSNLFNSRLAYVFFADNDNIAQSYKKMLDNIASGQAATVVGKKLLNADGKLAYEIFNRDIKQSYIVDELITDLRRVESEFDTKIGIPNCNTDKKERLVAAEATRNSIECATMVDMWLNSIKKGFADVKQLFGEENVGKLEIEWRYTPDVNTDNNNSGNVPV